MTPSGNQKRRSKLGQAAAPNESSPPPPEPAAEEDSLPPPVIGSAPDHGVRKFRLKRSGQMHEDLTGPMPEDDRPKERESEY